MHTLRESASPFLRTLFGAVGDLSDDDDDDYSNTGDDSSNHFADDLGDELANRPSDSLPSGGIGGDPLHPSTGAADAAAAAAEAAEVTAGLDNLADEDNALRHRAQPWIDAPPAGLGSGVDLDARPPRDIWESGEGEEGSAGADGGSRGDGEALLATAATGIPLRVPADHGVALALRSGWRLKQGSGGREGASGRCGGCCHVLVGVTCSNFVDLPFLCGDAACRHAASTLRATLSFALSNRQTTEVQAFPAS